MTPREAASAGRGGLTRWKEKETSNSNQIKGQLFLKDLCKNMCWVFERHKIWSQIKSEIDSQRTGRQRCWRWRWRGRCACPAQPTSTSWPGKKYSIWKERQSTLVTITVKNQANIWQLVFLGCYKREAAKSTRLLWTKSPHTRSVLSFDIVDRFKLKPNQSYTFKLWVWIKLSMKRCEPLSASQHHIWWLGGTWRKDISRFSSDGILPRAHNHPNT